MFDAQQERELGITSALDIVELLSVALPYDTDNLKRREQLVHSIEHRIETWEANRMPHWWQSILGHVWFLTGEWSRIRLDGGNPGEEAVTPHALDQVVCGWLAQARGESEMAMEAVSEIFPDGPDNPPTIAVSMFNRTQSPTSAGS